MTGAVTTVFLFDFGSPNAYLAHQVIPAIEARTDDNGRRTEVRGQAQAGFIMGIIGTVLMVLMLVLLMTGALGAILSTPTN